MGCGGSNVSIRVKYSGILLATSEFGQFPAVLCLRAPLWLLESATGITGHFRTYTHDPRTETMQQNLPFTAR